MKINSNINQKILTSKLESSKDFPDFKQILKYFMILIFVFSSSPLLTQNLDIDLLKEINVENPAEDHFWMGVTHSAFWVPPVYGGTNLIYGLAANDRNAFRNGLAVGLSVGISTGITQTIKTLAQRRRPYEKYPDVIHTYPGLDTTSFPSGHTSFSFAGATAMAGSHGFPWYTGVPIFSWSGSVGFSRMRLGKHYPTDVLTGILIGIGSGILGNWIAKKIVKPGESHHLY